MGFIPKKTNKKETLSKDELFTKFMLEIKQYSEDESGNILITGPYIKSTDLADKFKDWLKKRS